ncbi:SRPBCC family protein [Streptomyces sp. B6B3]|uniref:SRPBCC family protein n=1 Tax=Streptomyces sp. B6B3 TaxID=3153570 RepID=UPI00325C77BC
MADSALSRLRKDVLDDPAVDRLKQELGAYVQARATHAAGALGRRLAQSEGPGGMVKGLAQGGQALAEGKSPPQAALKVGTTHAMDTIKDKIKGFFGKKLKSGGGKAKSVTIIEDIDVGVSRREAYDQWSQFQEFSTFAKGVVSVEKTDDTGSNWRVKVAKSTRSWKATVTEQIPDERIVWTTEGAKATVKGVVTFHAVTDNLTRVLLVLEYFPKGLFEKTGNIWRAQGRRARLDLKLYRRFVMTRDEPAEGWRGEIRDGEVVLSHEEAVEEEERAAEASEPEPDDEPYDDEEPESEEAAEDRYEESEDEPEDEPEDEESEEERYADEELEEEPDEEREAVGARR